MGSDRKWWLLRTQKPNSRRMLGPSTWLMVQVSGCQSLAPQILSCATRRVVAFPETERVAWAVAVG